LNELCVLIFKMIDDEQFHEQNDQGKD